MNARLIDCQDETNQHELHQLQTGSMSSGRQRVKPLPGDNQIKSDLCLRTEARQKAQEGDFTLAINILTLLIDRNPSDAVNYNNRGLIYFQSGQMAEAIADYDTALELNPELDSIYNNRANYYASQGRLAEAISDYEMAIARNPANIRAWINQGITFREMELYDLALGNFDFVLRLGQLEANIYAERGRTYHLRGDWNCAIADYRRALTALSPSQPTLRLRLQVETWLNSLIPPANGLNVGRLKVEG